MSDRDLERRPPNEYDSGEIETLPDGSISIPVLEERLVVSKRRVVRERIVVGKQVVTQEQEIEADLRSERIEIDVDRQVADVVHVEPELDVGVPVPDEPQPLEGDVGVDVPDRPRMGDDQLG